MKGLLIKDLKILKNQMRYSLFIAFIGIMFIITNNNATFGISYITFIFAFFTISTISYDDLDNGMAYIFTLPVDRKTYALEKYIIGIAFTIASWLVSTIVCVVVTLAKGKKMEYADMFSETIAVLMGVLIMLSIIIAVQIKFGAEKSRIVMMGIFGGIFLVSFTILKLGEKAGIYIDKVINILSKMNVAVILTVAIIITLTVVVILEKITERVLMNREY